MTEQRALEKSLYTKKTAPKILVKLKPKRIVEVAAHVRLLRTLVNLGHVTLHPVKSFKLFRFFLTFSGNFPDRVCNGRK